MSASKIFVGLISNEAVSGDDQGGGFVNERGDVVLVVAVKRKEPIALGEAR